MVSELQVDTLQRKVAQRQPSDGALPRTTSQIAVLGWYGNGNSGDEAVLSCLLADLRSIWPNATLCVFSGDPEETRKTHGVIAIKKALLRNWREAARTIRSSQLLVMGGGTLICDQDTAYSGVTSICAYMLIAMTSSVPVVFYAQGIGPIRRTFNRWLVKRLVNRET